MDAPMDVLRGCFMFSFLGLRSNEQWLGELLGHSSEDRLGSEKAEAGFEGQVFEGLSIRQCLTLMRARSYFESMEFSRAFGVLRADDSLSRSGVAVFMMNYYQLLSLERENTKVDRLEDMVTSPSEASVISLKYSKIEMEVLNFLTFTKSSDGSKERQEIIGLLEWLASIAIYRQNRFLEALEFQINSLRKAPLNWSCWQDLVRNLISNGQGGSVSSFKAYENLDRSEFIGEESFMNENLHRNSGLQPFKKQSSGFSRNLRDSSFKDFMDSLGLDESMCAHLAYALYLEMIGRWDDALNEYNQTLGLIPNSIYIESRIARCNREIGKIESAIRIHDSILKKDKTFLGNVVELASIFSETKNIKELTVLADRCVELSKYSVDTCVVLGMYHWLTNDKYKALRFYKRALLLDSKSSPTWVLCGYALHELGNIRSSLFAYRTALNLDSTNVQAIFGIAQIYSRLDLHAYSIKLYEKALNQSPGDAFLWYNLGISLEKAGNYQEASRSFYKALSCESSKHLSSDAEIKYMGKLLKLETDQWNQAGSLYWARKIITKAIELGFLEETSPKVGSSFENSSVSAVEDNEIFSNWQRLRWSIRMVPQKLPIDLIVALECILQLHSTSTDEKDPVRDELLVENIRELLSNPKSAGTAKYD
ncbi:TPR domain-containing protein [Cryptosporidium canis]|uniref:TPR domain-containing protein n=1 Tax=Cryptosporidium canis TaxID=195482 RepID=A0ABQ8PCP7_9CRYT|nr:TPR domain-containing protein [Cryptosporidium canis]KAJ1615482.1 TPR domain-containing protein [Cryptosporidium canis]